MNVHSFQTNKLWWVQVHEHIQTPPLNRTPLPLYLSLSDFQQYYLFTSTVNCQLRLNSVMLYRSCMLSGSCHVCLLLCLSFWGSIWPLLLRLYIHCIEPLHVWRYCLNDMTQTSPQRNDHITSNHSSPASIILTAQHIPGSASISLTLVIRTILILVVTDIIKYFAVILCACV